MSEEVQNALKAIQLGNEDRILVTCTDVWPGPMGEEIRIEDVPEWMLPNMKAAYAQDGRVIDLASTTGKAVRWWQVVGYCRAMGVNHVPIHFDGAGQDAPAELLTKGKYVAMRRASEGPWLLVTHPGLTEERERMAKFREAMKEAYEAKNGPFAPTGNGPAVLEYRPEEGAAVRGLVEGDKEKME